MPGRLDQSFSNLSGPNQSQGTLIVFIFLHLYPVQIVPTNTTLCQSGIMTASNESPFYPKDFIETAEGLIFAVVAQGVEQNKVLSFLRYVRDDKGCKKYATADANALLQQHYPEYLHYSETLDAQLHAVPVSRIVRHHRPRQCLRQIIEADRQDAVERDLLYLCELFERHGVDLNEAGVTGSLLIGTQQNGSDIDFICYSREAFQQCRTLIEKLIAENHLQALHDDAWLESFERRSCDLSLTEYIWHERRKFNKALINGRKFDLNFVDLTADAMPVKYQKLGSMTLCCEIIDDTGAFDYPAEYKIANEQIGTVVCFTATYTGQAFKGERVEVSGSLEQSEQGELRIVVGATREAEGEYIKVVQDRF